MFILINILVTKVTSSIKKSASNRRRSNKGRYTMANDNNIYNNNINFQVNVIKNVHVFRDAEVKRIDETWLLEQPNQSKDKLALFNYWSEKKRKSVSDEATTSKLVLDFDGGAKRHEIEERFNELDYIIYNSTGNKLSEGIEKFRVIITLKDPVKAIDLRDARNEKKFIDFFDGCDKSSFAIGRFFVRPSRYDKDGQEVTITHHKGVPFDFYATFERKAHLAAWDALLDKMRASMAKPVYKKQEQIFDQWATEKFPAGVHYCDICSFCLRAHSCGLDVYEAKSRFAERYAGSSKWEPNFVKFFNSLH